MRWEEDKSEYHQISRSNKIWIVTRIEGGEGGDDVVQWLMIKLRNQGIKETQHLYRFQFGVEKVSTFFLLILEKLKLKLKVKVTIVECRVSILLKYFYNLYFISRYHNFLFNNNNNWLIDKRDRRNCCTKNN